MGWKEGKKRDRSPQPLRSLGWSSAGLPKWTAGFSLILRRHLPRPLSGQEDQARGKLTTITDRMPLGNQLTGPNSPQSLELRDPGMRGWGERT